ncbi:MAG: cupin domain-containing protein [Proteobacteria bacterium]|jgi:quercetin dioxygenase-like cupin family protein|nr:cupin domain-containing protein [Pseudomonadota bacterium]
MKVNRSVDKISWVPHPTAQGVKIKPLISEKEHGLDVTCMLVNVPAGKEVPEHIHENQEDILYPLQGRAVMWVDGTGNFSLEPGVIVRVPKGKKHKITNITEDLLIYDVFFPALL